MITKSGDRRAAWAPSIFPPAPPPPPNLGFPPPLSLFPPPAGNQRLDPGDDHEIWGPPRGLGRFDLARELLDPGEGLTAPGQEAVILGELLILEGDASDTRLLKPLDRVEDVVRVAVACIPIDDHGNRGHLDHASSRLQVLTHGEEAGVRDAVGRGDLQAARPDPLKSGPLDELCAQAVMGPDHPDEAGPGK